MSCVFCDIIGKECRCGWKDYCCNSKVAPYGWCLNCGRKEGGE